jgi:hypothetical protein
MEMTKKEVREQGKEVKRPEIDPAKNRIVLYTPTPPSVLTRFDLAGRRRTPPASPPNAKR